MFAWWKKRRAEKEEERLERLQKERERVRTAIMDCLAEKQQTGEKPSCRDIVDKLREADPKLRYLGVLYLLLELVNEGKVVKEITQEEQVRYCVT